MIQGAMRSTLPFLATLTASLVLSIPTGLLGCGGDGGSGSSVNTGVPDILTTEEPKAGFQFLETTYTVPGTNAERTIRLNVWYATEDLEGTTARFNLISQDPNSLLDATVSVPRGRAPLMIYSHGDRAWGGSNNALARQFVRNGWIVVAPDHTGNTFFDNTVPRPFEFDVVRAYDLQATLDFMANLPSDHPLAGHVETSRVLVAGHSYGGHTAWIAGGPELDLAAIEAGCAPNCVQSELDAYAMYEPDSRVVGVVALDGGIGATRVADAGFASMIAPMLFMTPTDDAADEALFTRSAGADVTWVQLAGACHESFTGTLTCPTLELSTSLPITATYAIAFGIRHVLQSNDAALLDILDGTTEVDPVVTFDHHD